MYSLKDQTYVIWINIELDTAVAHMIKFPNTVLKMFSLSKTDYNLIT